MSQIGLDIFGECSMNDEGLGEKDMIMKVLKECGGNVSKAALQLGLSRKGLQLKMAKYNLRRQDI